MSSDGRDKNLIIIECLKHMKYQLQMEIFTKLFLVKELNITAASIDSIEKKEGIQEGFIAKVEGKHMFHIKTHQRGRTVNSSESNVVDPRELIIYKLFSLINIGPNVHFFFNETDPKEFYIITEDLGEKFVVFEKLYQNKEFEELFEREPVIKSQIVFIHLITKILFLSDLLNNYNN